jgi:hypothetical protein
MPEYKTPDMSVFEKKLENVVVDAEARISEIAGKAREELEQLERVAQDLPLRDRLLEADTAWVAEIEVPELRQRRGREARLVVPCPDMRFGGDLSLALGTASEDRTFLRAGRYRVVVEIHRLDG